MQIIGYSRGGYAMGSMCQLSSTCSMSDCERRGNEAVKANNDEVDRVAREKEKAKKDAAAKASPTATTGAKTATATKATVAPKTGADPAKTPTPAPKTPSAPTATATPVATTSTMLPYTPFYQCFGDRREAGGESYGTGNQTAANNVGVRGAPLSSPRQESIAIPYSFPVEPVIFQPPPVGNVDVYPEFGRGSFNFF